MTALEHSAEFAVAELRRVSAATPYAERSDAIERARKLEREADSAKDHRTAARLHLAVATARARVEGRPPPRR